MSLKSQTTSPLIQGCRLTLPSVLDISKPNAVLRRHCLTSVTHTWRLFAMTALLDSSSGHWPLLIPLYTFRKGLTYGVAIASYLWYVMTTIIHSKLKLSNLIYYQMTVVEQWLGLLMSKKSDSEFNQVYVFVYLYLIIICVFLEIE